MLKTISILSILLLAGCSWADKVEVKKKAVERMPLNLESPQAPDLKSIKFVVITEENFKEVFEQLKQNGIDPVLFGLTDDGYEALALNFAEIRKYIILHKEVLQKYRDYYEGNSNGDGK